MDKIVKTQRTTLCGDWFLKAGSCWNIRLWFTKSGLIYLPIFSRSIHGLYTGLLEISLAEIAATTTNKQKPFFVALQKRLCGQLAHFKRSTRSFILEIAEAHASCPNEALESLTLNELRGHRVTNPNSFLFHYLDLAESSRQVRQSQIADIFGRDFVMSIFGWLVGCEGLSDGTSLVSFLELFIGWRMATGHYIPVEDPISRRWVDPDNLLVDCF